MSTSSTGPQVSLTVENRINSGASHRLAQLLFGQIDLNTLITADTTTVVHNMISTAWSQLGSTSYAGEMST